MSELAKCLVKECGRSANGSRGLCNGCYQAARFQVKSGNTTWEELQSLGLATRGRSGRPKSPFSIALTRKRAEQDEQGQT